MNAEVFSYWSQFTPHNAICIICMSFTWSCQLNGVLRGQIAFHNQWSYIFWRQVKIHLNSSQLFRRGFHILFHNFTNLITLIIVSVSQVPSPPWFHHSLYWTITKIISTVVWHFFILSLCLIVQKNMLPVSVKTA